MDNDFGGIYSGGAVTFNPLPYLQMNQNIIARQQAKQEAVDNYYREMNKGLTPAGMFPNDVNDFTDKVNQWRDYVTQNRNILSNPSAKDYGQTTNQANYLYNDALNHAEVSKQKAKQFDEAVRLIKPGHPLTDATMNMLHTATLPVSNGYQPLDLSQVQYTPSDKPTTAGDLIKYQNFVKSGLQMSEGQPSISVDPNTKSKVVTTTSSYNPDAINTIARRSEFLYNSDPKFHAMVKDMASDPDQYDQLNQAFKQTYGHDLDIQYPEEFATALLLGQTSSTKTQPYNYSPYTPYDYEAQREKYYNYTQGNQQAQGNAAVDKLVDSQIQFAKNPFNSGLPLPVDGATLKELNVDNLRLTGNDEIVGEYKDKDGNVQHTAPMTIDQYKAAIGKRNVGAKYFEQPNTQTKSTTTKKVYKGLDANGNPIFE